MLSAIAARKAQGSIEEPENTQWFMPQPSRNLFTLDGTSLLHLQTASPLLLFGTYQLQVVAGIVNVNGVLLSPSPTWHRVFAPTCAPVPVIQAVSPLRTSSIPAYVPEALHGFIQDPSSCVTILVRQLQSNIRLLTALCHPFRNVFSSATEGDLGIPGATVASRSESVPFVVPPSWEPSLLSFDSLDNEEPPVVIVIGHKRTGKSTFARTLVNRVLQRYQKVAYLDCDLGQAEFTPGGLISLHVVTSTLFGPAFSHPALPHTSHFMGSTTPRDIPERYIAAIRHLVSVYREDIALSALNDDNQESFSSLGYEDLPAASPKSTEIPLIVNTMGWTKGLGKDLLDQVIDILQPTDIISTSRLGVGTSTPPELQSTMLIVSPNEKIRIHELEAVPTSSLTDRFSAKDWRAISTLSYFYASFPPQSPSLMWTNKPVKECMAHDWVEPVPFSNKVPYELHIPAAVDGLYLIGAGSEDVVEEEVGGTLVGSLAGLVRKTFEWEQDDSMDMDNAGSSTGARHRLPYSPGRISPPPEESECIGLAFIRSLDTAQQSLQMLTPLPPTMLAQSNPRLIVKGCDPSFEMPLSSWISSKPPQNEGQDLPYLSWGRATGAGAARRRVRRNLMRKGQM